MKASNSSYSLLLLLSVSSFKLIFSATVFCPEIEQQSLISFWQSLQDPNNLLSSWNGTLNCCNWKGVICDNSTGHVHELHLQNTRGIYHGLKGKINSSLLNLKHLRHLDLSRNTFSGETIPSFIGSFPNLEYLNLSGSAFRGKIPRTIGNLLNLHTLDLKAFPYLGLEADSLEWLTGLSRLEYLNMDFVNLSAAYNWAQVITSLPSLVELHFQACSLEYIAPLDYVNSTTLKHLYIADNNFRYKSSISIPRWIFQLHNLLYLDLSNNSFVGSISTISNATKLRHIDLSDNHFYSSIPHWFYLCKHLEFVDLSLNSLSGTISNSVANLTSLNTLRVTSNQLSGKIPKEIVNLCKIQRLDLSDNFFQGEISDSFGNMSECFLESLQHLRLRNTALSGHLPNQFGDFKSLRYLNLGVNSLSGAIPISLGKLSSLEQLWLHANKFTGTLPESFGLLSSLQKLFMNDNMLEGVVTEAHFANLTKLDKFFATGNHLTLNVSPNWNPPFNLTTLRITSWSLGAVGSQIPVWLETQKNIRDLDLSNTGISGSIPSWVWKVEILTLSHNNLSGKIPDLIGLKNKYIYLGSNQFSGSLPRVTGTLRQLDLSNNSFSGGVSHLLCDTRNENYNLSVLNLGGNQLIGELPDCWMKWPSLKYLNLGNNNMSGSIPNSIGHLAALQSLNLYGNRLSGAIPFSMHNCTELVKIDFRDNNLDGGLPTWVGTELLKLAFLVLGSNKLSGSISSEICHLNSLQILDLSGNEFLGVIPRCVYNFTGMATERNYSRYKYSWWVFIDSVLVDDKGSEFEYGTTLSLVTNINLSKNNLSGDIPKGLTSLAGLRSLNLSRNRLTGSIPERIGDMKQLESLDLSINSVSGEIPSSFTILTFLNHLNLSHNNLSGRIPKSTQLQSLDASSFTGNNLCGSPLEINCSGDVDEPHRHKDKDSEDEGENESKIEWFYVLLSLGYAVGLSVVCTTLVLKKSWREGYFSSDEEAIEPRFYKAYC
ncbi:hypothetical protein ACS0TY_036657 [Phlomoides rotata]